MESLIKATRDSGRWLEERTTGNDEQFEPFE
jgi:hypothetical protein